MITLPYSLVIEATKDPDFFGFYSNDLEGFTGIGHSIEDCLYKARWGMADHAQTLREQGLPVPTPNPNPTIVIQNDSKLHLARFRSRQNELPKEAKDFESCETVSITESAQCPL